jgi:cell division topological specificity factor
MNLFEFFLPKRPASAAIAKERLQIVLAHERAGRDGPDFLPQMQRELLAVVAKYVEVDDDMIRVNLEKSGTASVLEINVELGVDAKPVKARPAKGPAPSAGKPARAGASA